MRDQWGTCRGGTGQGNVCKRKESERVLITAMHLSEWYLELKGSTCRYTTSPDLRLAGQVHWNHHPSITWPPHNPLHPNPVRQNTQQKHHTHTIFFFKLLLLLLLLLLFSHRQVIYEAGNRNTRAADCERLCVMGILDRIDVCAYTLIKAVPLSTL